MSHNMPRLVATLWPSVEGNPAARWQSEDEYRAYLEEATPAAQRGCERGLGRCGLKLTLDSFTREGDHTVAKVLSVCYSQNCPNILYEIDAAMSLPGDEDRMCTGWREQEEFRLGIVEDV